MSEYIEKEAVINFIENGLNNPDKTEYGDGHFAITIFDRRIFVTSCFEYVKDVEKEKYYVKTGKWVGEEDE